MNEKEKKTIENLKKFKSIKVLYGNTFTMFTEQLDELQKSIETILNLIDKQQKENKKQKKMLNNISEEFLKYDWKNSNPTQIHNQLKDLYENIFLKEE